MPGHVVLQCPPHAPSRMRLPLAPVYPLRFAAPKCPTGPVLLSGEHVCPLFLHPAGHLLAVTNSPKGPPPWETVPDAPTPSPLVPLAPAPSPIWVAAFLSPQWMGRIHLALPSESSPSRAGPANLFCKRLEMGNILVFVAQILSIVTAQICHCSVKAATGDT